MRVDLAYGAGHISIDCPDGRTTVIEPAERFGLPDERTAVARALAEPIGSRPLRKLVGPDTGGNVRQ